MSDGRTTLKQALGLLVEGLESANDECHDLIALFEDVKAGLGKEPVKKMDGIWEDAQALQDVLVQVSARIESLLREEVQFHFAGIDLERWQPFADEGGRS